jgi:hypothetical protein
VKRIDLVTIAGAYEGSVLPRSFQGSISIAALKGVEACTAPNRSIAHFIVLFPIILISANFPF